MKNWQVNTMTKSHPRYVILHAILQAKKGRNPSAILPGVPNPRHALRLAARILEIEEEGRQQLAKKVESAAAKLNRVWRCDTENSANPTASWVVVHAKDQVVADGYLEGFVLHVNTIHGKGFRAKISSSGHVCSGEVFLGTKSEDYQKALDSVHQLLGQERGRLKEHIRKTEHLWRNHQNGTRHNRALMKLPKSLRRYGAYAQKKKPGVKSQ